MPEKTVLEELQDKAIDIKGKDYILIKDRIMAFHELYPNGSITTECWVDDRNVRFKATVVPDVNTSTKLYTGHSEAIRGGVGISGQKPIEKAESSAVGRALAFLGIGVIESIASAEEVLDARQQENYQEKFIQKEWSATLKQKEFIQKLVKQKLSKNVSIESMADLTLKEAKEKIDKLMTLGEPQVSYDESEKVEISAEDVPF